MPRKPAAPCTFHGYPPCPALVPGGGRCPDHTVVRASAHARGYDARWSRTRAKKLKATPLCEWPGCTKPATDVDHIDGQGPNSPHGHDQANLQSLCHPHHSTKTAKQDGGFGRGKRVG